ncbi:hypothetical protein ACODT4_41340 [Streptomyces sp. 2.9]|uniref:hypothetical protein n=1 Tax=Streptomyces tritrimontium TaxID=3406573 RepID=UPI003BB6155B
MPLDDKTQWTVTLTPAEPAGPAPWKATVRRWLMTAVALLLAYWIGTANTDGTAAQPPAPASTQPSLVTSPRESR